LRFLGVYQIICGNLVFNGVGRPLLMNQHTLLAKRMRGDVFLYIYQVDVVDAQTEAAQ
jgi:hypothetical protein